MCEVRSNRKRIVKSEGLVSLGFEPIMTDMDLFQRTKNFSRDCILLTREFPHNQEAWVIAKQLIRSASGVGANYRSAKRARSRKEFASKLAIVVEEADESGFWLELTADLNLIVNNSSTLKQLIQEADEITRMMNSARIKSLKPQSEY